MKYKKITLIIIAVLVLIAIIWYFYPKPSIYEFKYNSFRYSKDRPKPDYSLSLNSENGSLKIFNINFKTRNFLDQEARIYGLLVIPKNKENIPGLIFLPAGQATKEGRLPLAKKISELGYAVFIIDQRGVGQTGGTYLNFNQDYQVFEKNKEPFQHLMVYDVLASFDVLKEIDTIDKDNIALIGESMGGRYAIIAAAQDDRIKGVIGISTSGFGIFNDGTKQNSYLLSIDPNNYIGRISPNKVFMIHSTNDSLIPFKDAQNTFNLANNPKQFYQIDKCDHGYCEEMFPYLEESLNLLFQ